jgi:hypothetical protein
VKRYGATALDRNLVILSLLLLSGLCQQMNGQKREPRKFFPIDDNTAFIDITGQVVIHVPPSGEVSNRISYGEFSEGLAVAVWAMCPRCANPFYVNGIIDETGRLVIPPKNSNTCYGGFHDGLARYSDRGWGFIDRQGHVVIPAKSHEVSDFSEGLAWVRLTETGTFGYLNQKGALAIPYQFDWARDFHDGLAAVRFSKSKYGFIDKTGKVVLTAKQWLQVDDFSEGLAGVRVEVTDNSVYVGYRAERTGYIDRTGTFVIQPRFDRPQKFSEGRALFFQTGKNSGYGFIDLKGHVVIKPEYVEAKGFAEGLAAVAITSSADKKLWGYIDETGQWVIKPQFQSGDSFDGGLAAINCDEDGKNCKAYIDRAGKIRWQTHHSTGSTSAGKPPKLSGASPMILPR